MNDVEMKNMNSTEGGKLKVSICEKKYTKFPFFVGSVLKKQFQVSSDDFSAKSLAILFKDSNFKRNFTVESLKPLSFSLRDLSIPKFVELDGRIDMTKKLELFSAFAKKNVEPRPPAVIESLLKKCIDYIAKQISEFAKLYHPLIDESSVPMLTPFHMEDLPAYMVKPIYERIKEMNEKLPKQIEDFFSEKLIEFNPIVSESNQLKK